MINKESNENSEDLRAFAAATVGTVLEIKDFSRKFGRKSVTWRIISHQGQVFYLKQHEERKLYETELIVYTRWIPKLANSSELRTSVLVGNSDELGAMILTAVPGEILDKSQATLEEQMAMHRLAGRFASEIHQLGVDPHEAGPARLYGPDTWDRNLKAAVPYLDKETLRWIEQTAAQENLFDGLALVPTHCDFSPRNWLISRSRDGLSLGLIDWERARPGYWLEDAQRLVFDCWQTEPRLRDEFFEGYGRSPSATEKHQLNLICLSNALGTVSWATEHGDLEFAGFGKRVLAKLKDKLG